MSMGFLILKTFLLIIIKYYLFFSVWKDLYCYIFHQKGIEIEEADNNSAGTE